MMQQIKLFATLHQNHVMMERSVLLILVMLRLDNVLTSLFTLLNVLHHVQVILIAKHGEQNNTFLTIANTQFVTLHLEHALQRHLTTNNVSQKKSVKSTALQQMLVKALLASEKMIHQSLANVGPTNVMMERLVLLMFVILSLESVKIISSILHNAQLHVKQLLTVLHGESKTILQTNAKLQFVTRMLEHVPHKRLLM
jgi:hypothetical protein